MDTDLDAAKTSAARARLLSRFEQWLDSALASERPPEGLPAGLLAALDAGEPLPPLNGGSDLYSLWSAMTALTQEVKLQGRTFRQLNDTLDLKLESLAVAREQNATPVPAADNKFVRTQLDLLLDLRDRFHRGLEAVRQADAELPARPQPFRLFRWLGQNEAQRRLTQDTLTALEQGYALTLERLDQALKDSHLYPIPSFGLVFDPHRMTAVALEEAGAVPEGTVVAVYREGYEWNGQFYRAAEVKVARRRGNSTTGEKQSE